MAWKAFLLLGLFVSITLLYSSTDVAARNLAETSSKKEISDENANSGANRVATVKYGVNGKFHGGPGRKWSWPGKPGHGFPGGGFPGGGKPGGGFPGWGKPGGGGHP